VEVYLDDYDWVPFDPAFDDNNGDSIYSTFEDLKNVYIYMPFVRNDEVLKNYHFCAYTYWGDNVEVVKNVKFLKLIKLCRIIAMSAGTRRKMQNSEWADFIITDNEHTKGHNKS